MLSRHTPVAVATPHADVGIVVGVFRNCGGSDAFVHDVHLVTATGTSAKPVGFWVAPLSVASPGTAIPARVLSQQAIPLPADVHIAPAVSPSRALVLEVSTSNASGTFGPAYTVDALKVQYFAGGRSYDAPFASIGRLRVHKPSV